MSSTKIFKFNKEEAGQHFDDNIGWTLEKCPTDKLEEITPLAKKFYSDIAESNFLEVEGQIKGDFIDYQLEIGGKYLPEMKEILDNEKVFKSVIGRSIKTAIKFCIKNNLLGAATRQLEKY